MPPSKGRKAKATAEKTEKKAKDGATVKLPESANAENPEEEIRQSRRGRSTKNTKSDDVKTTGKGDVASDENGAKNSAEKSNEKVTKGKKSKKDAPEVVDNHEEDVGVAEDVQKTDNHPKVNGTKSKKCDPDIIVPSKEAKKENINSTVKKASQDVSDIKVANVSKRTRAFEEEVLAKRQKIDKLRLGLRGSHLDALLKQGAQVFTNGQGDTGQLGHGPDVPEAGKPKLVQALADKPVVAISAGGMHTICVLKDGTLFSFGCNDDGALGRPTAEDDEIYTPGKIDIPAKIVQVSSGDSHSAALTEDGLVYLWGNIRDNSGNFGLTPEGVKKEIPCLVDINHKIKKIASGDHHVCFLTEEGLLYTAGCAEQGRLGRVSQHLADRGGRRGIGLPLKPGLVYIKAKPARVVDVWAGSLSTVILTLDNEVFVCGLNNYGQLGVEGKIEIFVLTLSPALTKIAQEHGLAQVAFGQHHVLLLDGKGHVYSLGRHNYGVLGLGKGIKDEVRVPTQVSEKMTCVEIACGSSVSFAVTKDGVAYCWGLGTNSQLAQADEEDVWNPQKMSGKQLEGKKVVAISSGGQHTILLAKPSK